MKASNIILASIAGTTAMSLFSYAVSHTKNKNFKEPQLLGELTENAIPDIKTDTAQAAGWITHYAVGALFAAVYSMVLKKTKIAPSFANGAIVGGLSGIPAVLGWNTTFKIHPALPKTDYKRYYGHLVLAHMVFGAFTFLFFKKKQFKGSKIA
ncbi:MAG: hypothetical protein IPJ81_05330 [Chitinophagaceae bacterium]|nr:hypothetical protein [Chitinophagaceae bacterium]